MGELILQNYKCYVTTLFRAHQYFFLFHLSFKFQFCAETFYFYWLVLRFQENYFSVFISTLFQSFSFYGLKSYRIICNILFVDGLFFRIQQNFSFALGMKLTFTCKQLRVNFFSLLVFFFKIFKVYNKGQQIMQSTGQI